jgi:septal ring-binding cell division protein DamX
MERKRQLLSVILMFILGITVGYYLMTSRDVTAKKVSIAQGIGEPKETEVTISLPIDEEGSQTKQALNEDIDLLPSHNWAFQLSACQVQEQAADLLDKLKVKGLPAYLTEAYVKGQKWYRIRLGFYPTKQEALNTGEKIASEFGLKNYWAVPVDKKEVKRYINELNLVKTTAYISNL